MANETGYNEEIWISGCRHSMPKVKKKKFATTQRHQRYLILNGRYSAETRAIERCEESEQQQQQQQNPHVNYGL